MNITLASTGFAILATFFVGVAFIGEYVALGQMRTRQYRAVPLVRALRRGQYLALLFGAAFIACGAAVNPRATAAGVAIGLFAGVTLSAPALLQRLCYQPFMRLIVPVVVVFVALFHAQAIATPPNLGLGWLNLGLLTAFCCGTWLVAYFRELQQLEAWRD